MEKTKIDKQFLRLTLEKIIIGIEEPMLVKGVGEILAKIDSGNGGFNVIHGEDTTIQGDILNFKTTNKDGQERRVSKKIKEYIDVNIGGGHVQHRPVVELDVQIGGKDYKKIPFSVTDRSGNDNKILISKDFVGKELDALIDVTKKKIADNNIQVNYVTEGLKTWIGDKVDSAKHAVSKVTAPVGKAVGAVGKVAGAPLKAINKVSNKIGTAGDKMSSFAKKFSSWMDGDYTSETQEEAKIDPSIEEEVEAIWNLKKVILKEDPELIKKQVFSSPKLQNLLVDTVTNNKVSDGNIKAFKLIDYVGNTFKDDLKLPPGFEDKLKRALRRYKELTAKGEKLPNSKKTEKTEKTNESFLDLLNDLLLEADETPQANQGTPDSQAGQQEQNSAKNQQTENSGDETNSDVESTEPDGSEMTMEELDAIFKELKSRDRSVVYLVGISGKDVEAEPKQVFDKVKTTYDGDFTTFCQNVSKTKYDINAISQPSITLAQKMTASKDVKFKGLFAVCHGKSGSRRCDLGVNPQQIINTIASTKERKAAQDKAIEAYKAFAKKFTELTPETELTEASWKKWLANGIINILNDVRNILQSSSDDPRIKVIATDNDLTNDGYIFNNFEEVYNQLMSGLNKNQIQTVRVINN